MLNTNDRYIDEISFFDQKARKILNQNRTFKLTNTKTHIELFSEIPHLKPVVPFFGNIRNKKLLDLGCGDGWASLYFARSGAYVFCCDISPKCIELAKKYAEANGLADRITPLVMPAEELSFEDNFFDFVFMNAALHHCDVERVVLQIKRVLKKGGKAAIIEDFAYHPFLKIYRFLARSKHTKYEKPLSKKDIAIILSEFPKVEFKYTGLLNIFNSNNFWARKLELIDQKIFEIVPILRKFAKIIGIYIEK